MFILLCRVLVVILDLACNLLYPAYETLFLLAKFRKKETYTASFTHLAIYWIFYSVIYYLQRGIYFFPFSYEIRVIVTLLMAHPKI
jgi:hypothetical protein